LSTGLPRLEGILFQSNNSRRSSFSGFEHKQLDTGQKQIQTLRCSGCKKTIDWLKKIVVNTSKFQKKMVKA
jgi:hypothetical protein